VHILIKNLFVAVDFSEPIAFPSLGPANEPQKTIKDSHLLGGILKDAKTSGSDNKDQIIVIR
jgi:hypothetical protein